MKKLKTIEKKVKAVLTAHEEARDDDMKLYLYVCSNCQPKVGTMPFERVMKEYRLLGIPPFESIRRTRQKLQADCPELAGNLRVRQLRATQEQIYREYAGVPIERQE